MNAPATISVVVPSYRRPELLVRCLQGLARQALPPDQVVVVRRPEDAATAAVIAAAPLPVVEALVDEPGVLAAMRVGLAMSDGDVVVFTDDDAVGRPGWLATLVPHYADPAVGGVGGRDVKHPPGPERTCPSHRVGQVTRWGRHRGRHDVGTGPAADVDVLKGVNMSFRREALALPMGLRGEGAQVHHEIATSLWARSMGWRLRYDPEAVVDHFVGPRFDSDSRSRPSADAISNEAHNLVFTMLSLRPEIWWRRALFGILVGDRASPGLGRALVGMAQRDAGVVRRLIPSARGQTTALWRCARGARVHMVALVPSAASPAAPRLGRRRRPRIVTPGRPAPDSNSHRG